MTHDNDAIDFMAALQAAGFEVTEASVIWGDHGFAQTATALIRWSEADDEVLIADWATFDRWAVSSRWAMPVPRTRVAFGAFLAVVMEARP